VTPSSLRLLAGVCRPLRFLSYRFSDGVIHDCLVPVSGCGVALVTKA